MKPCGSCWFFSVLLFANIRCFSFWFGTSDGEIVPFIVFSGVCPLVLIVLVREGLLNIFFGKHVSSVHAQA